MELLPILLHPLYLLFFFFFFFGIKSVNCLCFQLQGAD